MDTQHNPKQDKPRLHALADGMAAAGAQRSVDLRARTPAEMAMQLTRNATSLELVDAGRSESDQRFHEAVAADMREAANFLSQWQELVEQLRQRGKEARAEGRLAALLQSNRIAETVANLVPATRIDGPAATWRSAALAVAGAIMAIADSKIVPPEVQS